MTLRWQPGQSGPCVASSAPGHAPVANVLRLRNLTSPPLAPKLPAMCSWSGPYAALSAAGGLAGSRGTQSSRTLTNNCMNCVYSRGGKQYWREAVLETFMDEKVREEL
jgi:hypothetical protein